MMTDVFDRIANVLEINKMSARAASLQCGLSADTLGKILHARNNLPSTRTVQSFCERFGISETWLLTGEGEAPTKRVEASKQPPEGAIRRQHTSKKTIPSVGRQELMVRRDIPILDTRWHYPSSVEFVGGAIDYAWRPPSLARAKDVYAIYVHDKNMHSILNFIDLLVIAPNRPARIDDLVLVRTLDIDGKPASGEFGILKEIDSRSVKIVKYNSRFDAVEIDIKRNITVDKILTVNELCGA